MRSMKKPEPGLFSIGHSSHLPEKFIELLKLHAIDVVADVRSQPYSKYAPQFNSPELKALLQRQGLKYLFMGKELGGRPEGDEFYDETGRVLYDRVAGSKLFCEGISRLEEGRQKFRVALMCSEEDPAVCHRYLLISRVLSERGIEIRHIRGDGQLQSQTDVAGPDESPDVSQPVLFPETEESTWKSLRSVLPNHKPLW